MKKFKEFIDKKQRESKEHLGIIKRLLESQGMKVSDHLKEDDPFIFLHNPTETNVSFGGVRIYQIGSALAFRIQKEEKTHPFGQAYPMDIEEMFTDLLADNHNPEKAGRRVIQAVKQEVIRFFEKTAEAEKDLKSYEFDPVGDPMNRVSVRSAGVDYGNLVYTKGY